MLIGLAVMELRIVPVVVDIAMPKVNLVATSESRRDCLPKMAVYRSSRYRIDRYIDTKRLAITMRMPVEITRFYGELKRRKVVRAGMFYAIGAWFLLQLGEVTFEPLELPSWAMRALIYAVVIGFPFALVLAWFFDLTSKGIKRDPLDAKATSDFDEHASIAVLPFTDMSESQDQGYFCEGVSEAILNALTPIKNLQVASRTSSFQYRGKNDDIRTIGRQLSVKTVLEGSVQKFNDRLRITAQLIDVRNGYHIWSKQFDAELKDIFQIQDEIAQSIAEAQAPELSAREQNAIKTTSSSDVRAYEYYLRGRQFFHRFRGSDMEYARQMFDHAIEIDPDFALAWAGRADCFSFVEMYVNPDQQHRLEATRSSERALSLDPDSAESHASRGLAYLVCERYDQAIEQFETAIGICSTLFEPWYYYARASFHQGQLQKAADLFAKSAEVRPEDYQCQVLRGHVLYGLGQVELGIEVGREAVAVIEKHLKWHPDDARAYYLGAGALLQIDQRERAEEWIGKALEIDPTDSVVLYNVACFYALDGQAERALDCLEAAVDHGAVSASWMRNDGDLTSLRQTPRFQALLDRLEQ
jgi:TolB-like protein/Flp pilus assembly protein TadD